MHNALNPPFISRLRRVPVDVLYEESAAVVRILSPLNCQTLSKSINKAEYWPYIRIITVHRKRHYR
jgi:hypothetical protein